MKIVFLIDQTSCYRYFSTLVDYCIHKDCQIELWHCYFSNKHIKVKKSPFFNTANNSILFKKILTEKDLFKSISDSQSVDYFVSINPVTFRLSELLREKISGKWCIVQHGIDSFGTVWHWHKFGYDGALLQDYERLFFPYTTSFFNEGKKWIKKFSDIKGKNNYSFFDENTSVYPIGCCMYNRKYKDIDDNYIRSKYKISSQKKLLIYLPFPFYPEREKYTKNGSYAWQAAFSGMFLNHNNVNKNWMLMSYMRFFVKKVVYFSKVIFDREARAWLLKRWSEPKVIDTIKTFCEKNNLILVVKPRGKFPYTKKVYKSADLIINDNDLQHNPSKLQELFPIADLVVGYQSTAVLESILNNIPYLNIECPDSLLNHEESRLYFHRCHSGSMYNFKGVVTNMKIPHLITELHKKNIEEFNINKAQRDLYMEKYVGQESSNPAENFFKVINQSFRDSL